MFPIRIKACSESDLRMLGNLARNIQRVLPVTQADIDAAAALGKGWVVWKVVEVNDPIDNLRGGTQLVIKQNSITPGQNVRRVLIVSGPGGQTVVIGPGPSPLLLPDAVANSLQYVKAFGGTKQSNLPMGYTQVSYIYFLANSYLTTDINPSYDGRYEFDFQTTTLGSSGATTYLGVRPTSTGNGGLRIARISSQVFRIYGFGAYKDSTTTAVANTRYDFVWDNQHAVMTAGGNTVLDLTFTGTEACAYPITINGWNSAGTITPGSEGIFVYSFRAWNAQGELVADYVPTKDPDGVVGFYDTVSGTFKTATAGTIAAGPDATPTPTPDAPVDIVTNNGVLKYSPNELNPSDIEIGYYRVSGTGELTESPYNFVTGFMPVNPGQSYVFFGRRQNDNRLSSYNRIHWFDANKEFISTNSYTKDVVGTGVAPSNAYFAQCSCNESGATSRVTTQEIVDGYNWVFQQGTGEVPYVPYVDGGLYTDGLVETISAHGKNLNGGGALDHQGYTSTGGTSTSTTFCGTLWKIKVKPGEKYTISYGNFPDGVSGVFINTWLTDGTWNLRQAIAISGSYTYTVPAGVGEVNFTLYKTGGITIADNSWLQVEKGETATDYEPYYDGGTATAEMLLKVGDYQDIQSILDGAITRNVGVLVLDGTENWTYTNSAIYASLVSSGIPSASRTGYCTHFKIGTGEIISQMNNNEFIYNCNSSPSGAITNGNLSIKSTLFSSLAAAKAWLAGQYAAGTPVIVLYPLATSTTESVAGQALSITDGDNVLEITQAGMDGLELEAEYTKVA